MPENATGFERTKKSSGYTAGGIPSSAQIPVDAEPKRQAILVIHGIGQQQPFQPLDSFVNGLRATLRRDGKSAATTHHLLGGNKVFDHCISIDASDPELRLDVYEFHWASLTQGKASFTQIVGWLVATGFTPLRRFAYNFPLLRRRARSARGQCLEFGRELRRVVSVVLAAILLAALAVGIVDQSTELVKNFPALTTLAPALKKFMSLSGAATAVAMLVAVTTAIAILLSLHEQIEDLLLLRKQRPRGWTEVGRAAGRAYQTERTLLPGLLTGARTGAQVLWQKLNEEYEQWLTELQARTLFLVLSIVGFVVAGGAVYWLSSLPPMHDFLVQLPRQDLITVAVLLVAAYGLKRVFVDYLAGIALYTTADENSGFFRTRTAILTEAVRRIRVLLQDPQYASVAIAGHSLGSVIAYDAINWLRTEARLPRAADDREALDDLARLAAKLPVKRAAAAKAMLQRVGRTVEPISDETLSKLTTLITFGSPLNKVLYFFRTRVKVYETVRGHIIHELYGFRQMADLLTRDPGLERPETTPITDHLNWLNVHSPMDPVSAPLVFYDKVVEVRRWYLVWGRCHLDYWHDQKFYRAVLDALRSGMASAAMPASAQVPLH